MTGSAEVLSADAVTLRHPRTIAGGHLLWNLLWGRDKSSVGGFIALDGVSLVVRRGEAVAVLGRNGSGKTSLLEILAGTRRPTQGKVTRAGSMAALLSLGAGFHPDHTGRDNAELFAAFLGLSPDQVKQRFDGLLDFSGLGDFIDKPMRTYSSGMWLRLAFSVATLMNPDVLLVDELLAVGDIEFQQRCVEMLRKRLASERMAVLFATHDLQLVSSIATRAIVVEKGRLVFEGRPDNAIEAYLAVIYGHKTAGRMGESETHASESSAERVSCIAQHAWRVVENAQTIGKCELYIKRGMVSTASNPFPACIATGDQVVFDIVVETARPMRQALFGYLVRDRFGNQVFGENSYSVENGIIELAMNREYHVHFVIQWPEVAEGDYTITLGAAEGDAALGHVVQCWAQSFHTVHSSPRGRAVHGVFNNPIHRFECQPTTKADEPGEGAQ